MENEMLLRIKQCGLDITPKILIVSVMPNVIKKENIAAKLVPLRTLFDFFFAQVTRLLPDATGTTCGQRLEKVLGTEHCHILRVPFRTENGIVRKWISRFEVWPYLETYTDVSTKRY